MFIGTEAIEAVAVKVGNLIGAKSFIENGEIIKPTVEVPVAAAGVVADAPVVVGSDGLCGDRFGRSSRNSIDK